MSMTEQLELLPRGGRNPALFRPIHYLGNKWRVLGIIESAVADSAPSGAVCDLFSGSGVVAGHLGGRRPVVAADIQEYARVLASALLNPGHLGEAQVRALLTDAKTLRDETCLGPLAGVIAFERRALQEANAKRPECLATLLEHASLASHANHAPAPLRALLGDAAATTSVGPHSVLARYYGGVYFSYEQAAGLDALATVVRQLPIEYRDTAMAAVLSTASELVSTIGNQFAQPIRPRTRDGQIKADAVLRAAQRRRVDAIVAFRSWIDRYRSLGPSDRNHIVLRGDFRDVLADLPTSVLAVYADPPYTRDHYSRFYHVLETIALGDEPNISAVNDGARLRASRGIYRVDRHQSPFSIKTKVVPAFRALFEGASARGIPLVLSYSPYTKGSAARPRPRLLTIAQLETLLGEYFPYVEKRSAGRVAHSKLNAERLNIETPPEAETLFIGRFTKS
jgi:adenine-specific DNA-methyltransferase